MASFGGLQTSVRAISAAFLEGCRVTIYDGSEMWYLQPRGNYRRIERPSGDTTHVVLVSQEAIASGDEDFSVAIARDGNVRRAVGELLIYRYGLPEAWRDQYIDLLPRDTYWDLTVLVNPLAAGWQDLAAVKLSPAITEEWMLEAVASALKKGLLRVPRLEGPSLEGMFDPHWTTMREYLQANAQVLAAKLAAVKPWHDPATDPINPALAELGRIPFPAQAHMVQGIFNAFQGGEKVVFLNGDMGVGKSECVAALIHLMYKTKGRGMRVLLAAPGLTIPKWADTEIAHTLPYARVRILNRTEDALRLRRQIKCGEKPDGLEVVLVGTDRAKLGPIPWGAAVWRRMAGTTRYAWHCPDCALPLPDPEGDKYTRRCPRCQHEMNGPIAPTGTWRCPACGLIAPKPARSELPEAIPALWSKMAYGAPPATDEGPRTSNGLPKGFAVRWNYGSKLKKCPYCGAKLWRPAVKARGETTNRPRWFISRILKRTKGFDLFVQDEVHQAKAEDSGRGDAFAQMVRTARKTLSLTGTLSTGKSTSLKEILWRTDAQALLDEGFDHTTGMVQWASRYGVLERTLKLEDVGDVGVVTRQIRRAYAPVEKPGIAPQLTTHFLLHRTGFMDLGDLGLPLVEIKELPEFITLDPEHATAYKRFHEELREACQRAPGISGWSKFTPATVNYADRTDLGAEVQVDDELVYAPAFPPDYFTAKERRLVELVRQELAQDRGVLIYCVYTVKYGADVRLQYVLKQHGIDSVVLDSTVPQQERLQWLARREKEGARVIISHMRLLELGIDALSWPSVIVYQMTQEVNMLRQATRRSWRIGQTRECRVYYLVANETQQVPEFEKVMAKRGHAMLLEGRLDHSELARYSRDQHSALAYDLVECLASSGLAERWQELARRDMDQGLTLVSEREFRKVLGEAQQQLVQETMRLCGVTAKVQVSDQPELGLARMRIVVLEKPIMRGRRVIVPAGQMAFNF